MLLLDGSALPPGLRRGFPAELRNWCASIAAAVVVAPPAVAVVDVAACFERFAPAAEISGEGRARRPVLVSRADLPLTVG